MISMNVKEFEDLVLHSNKNIEKIATAVVNESSNAAFVAMYDDSVVLLDHVNGIFYSADYIFEDENLSIKFSNFEEIELTQENNDFRKNIREFFETEDSTTIKLTESYIEDVVGQERFINTLVNEAISKKDFEEVIDYTELAESNDDLEITKKPYFQKYIERINTHPVNEAKYFNFEDEVIVSLIETENKKLINSTIVEQAHDLWKREAFRTQFAEACETLVEDVEEGVSEIAETFSQFPQIFYLDKADRKSVFGKTLMSTKTLKENYDELLEGLELLFNENDNILELKEYYISEQEEKMEDEEGAADSEEDSEEEEAPELDPEEIKEITKTLKEIAEKIEDEGLKKKMDDVIGKLEESVDEGTRPDIIKEAVQLLTI